MNRLGLAMAKCWSPVGFGILVILIALAPVLADDDNGQRGRCHLAGSWMGYDINGMAYFVATHSSTTAESGTSMLESPTFDKTLGGVFSTAAMTTVGRGVWEKTGEHTYGWTGIGLVVDADGNALYLWKLAAVNKFNRDCDTVTVSSSTIEFFLPFANPFEDVPFYVYVGRPHTAMRITVDSPANP